MATKNDLDTGYPVEIQAGGTLKQSFTAYAVICGGTTTTGALQSVASVGTLGQALTSNGAAMLPSFKNFTSTSGSLVLLDTQTASNSASLIFSTGIDATYSNYYLVFQALEVTNAGESIFLDVSQDGGMTYVNNGYCSGVNTIGHDDLTSSNTNVSNGGQWTLTPPLSTAPQSMALWLCNLADAGQVNMMGDGAIWSSASNLRISSIMGYNSNTLTVNTLKITASAGTLASGTVYLYGLVQ